jgi:hypothetical protein
MEMVGVLHARSVRLSQRCCRLSVQPVCEAPRVTILYEADEDGWIVASVPEVRGVDSQGKTRAEAYANVMEVLRAVVDLRSAAR